VKEKLSPKVNTLFMFLDSYITYDSVQLFQLKYFINSCYINVCEGKIHGTKSQVTFFHIFKDKNEQGMYPRDMPGGLQKNVCQ
jgi:hypothetical protein